MLGPQPGPLSIGHLIEPAAVDLDAAAVWEVKTGNEVQQSRLSAAGRSHDREKFTPSHFSVEVSMDVVPVTPFGVVLINSRQSHQYVVCHHRVLVIALFLGI